MPFIGLANMNIRPAPIRVRKKVCSNKDCDAKGKKQPVSEFVKRGETNDGYAAQCRSCDRKRAKKKREESKNIIRVF
jgi:hypothetical protein